ncbi:16S rRNA (guanine(966)-N(2))-methyltransferase RsmD [Marivibrio halodurans]|uniref:16S rRNA (Guanine(966)-N(2))-methyltransferase RsmD n=1 Tax=Marivibrio halodurans TaxID=2039722 RepID=A0A8J7V3R8_9PROT|nr:16S rRNA (guanine(966)-N(2))-methyltransferase RsmD [Marivibrio halodurans]MBP5858267.1 16S rRNA (guanine(966)-N(2))-methyltransferase RsmD [Marivibrio halodurans]
MRIIAGTYRNQRLDAPPGMGTRPTSERAREALFNRLEHGPHRAILRGGTVADLFAGTGAVGLEALSRGAARALLVEREPAALRALEGNIRRLRIGAPARIVKADATRLPQAPEAADMLFLDPPYHETVAEDALASARAMGWLKPDALAVVQLHPKTPFSAPDGFMVEDSRRYGAAVLHFLRLDGMEGS